MLNTRHDDDDKDGGDDDEPVEDEVRLLDLWSQK